MRTTRTSSDTRPVDLAAFAHAIETASIPLDQTYAPTFVRLNPGDVPGFEHVCARHGITIIDTIDRQLIDLSMVRFPAADQVEARHRFIKDTIQSTGGSACYGTWVHFPWESKIVHVLAPDDYYDVITSRNHDKITREEQQILRKRRIGVVGLSVGGEIAVSVAQEHLCGTIVLADFDLLDLSNLNRLNAGVHELGHNKAHLAARRIATIDPYLRVVVYDEGITADNVEAFLEGLDLLIEECDNLALKYQLRELARARRLNVVYAADERGLLSVEPYARVPTLQPFHGLIDRERAHSTSQTTLTDMRALTEWLGGWDSISERSRRTVPQIGESLCGYPQLGSEPRLAAGQIGHVARRLLLDEPLVPFIAHLDLADQLPCAGQ